MKKLNWTYVLLGVIALLAIASLLGYPIIPPEALGGLGMVPLVKGEVTMSEIKQMIEQQGESWQVYKSRIEQIEDVLKKQNRPNLGNSFPGDSLDSPEKKAFLQFLRTGRESSELKSMQSGSDPAGGYLVPEGIETILSKNLREISPMRQLATVVPVGTAEYKQVHSVGGTGYTWVGETGARPETDAPSLKAINVPTREIYAMPGLTQNLLDDNAFGLETWLIEELIEAFGDGEGDAFINGNGVARPRGLFTYNTVTTADATRAHGDFQYVPTGASGAFAATQVDALITLIHTVKPRYRQAASWLVGPDFIEAVRKLKNPTTSEYIWRPGAELGQPDRLLGYPVYEDANVPAIAANSLSAAFGDFKRAYTITDRSTSMLRDPYTQKPYVMFYCAKRVGGGGGRDTRAVKFLKFSTT